MGERLLYTCSKVRIFFLLMREFIMVDMERGEVIEGDKNTIFW